MRPGSTSESIFAPELARGTGDDVAAVGTVNVPLRIVFASTVTVALGEEAFELNSESDTAKFVASGCDCDGIEVDVGIGSSPMLSEGSVSLDGCPLPAIDGKARDCIVRVDIVGGLNESRLSVTRLSTGTVTSPILSRPSCPDSFLPEAFSLSFLLSLSSVVFCRR